MFDIVVLYLFSIYDILEKQRSASHLVIGNVKNIRYIAIWGNIFKILDYFFFSQYCPLSSMGAGALYIHGTLGCSLKSPYIDPPCFYKRFRDFLRFNGCCENGPNMIFFWEGSQYPSLCTYLRFCGWKKICNEAVEAFIFVINLIKIWIFI